MTSPESTIILDFTENGSLPAALLRRLDELAESQREHFNTLIAHLSQGRDHEIDWWVSLPASRNTHSSLLFAKCMQLALVQVLLSENANISVQTDDLAMAQVLRPVLGGCRVTVKSNRIRSLKHAFWNVASSAFHTFSAHWAAKRTRALIRPLPRTPISVLEVYVQRDSFADGVFHDRYYPSFYESLDESERARLFYLPTFYRVRDYYAFFRNLRRSAQNFLVRQDYLNWRDYLFAFGYWWRARRLKGRAAQFAGFEVGPLVDADLERGRFSNIAIQSLLTYRFWCDIGQRDFAIRTIVDWHEGHDIDRATAAAINWHVNMPRLIAYRPVAPAVYLSVTPTLHEILCGCVAKEWGVVGKAMRSKLAQTYPQITVRAAPGLRHRKLLALRRSPRGDGGRTVLVVLSIDPRMAATVHKVIAPVSAASNGVNWLIKRHPAMPKEVAASIFCGGGANVTLVDGDFYELLERADLLVGLGTNTLMEAVAAGVPAICLSGGNRPTEIPLPTGCGWWRMAYDANEFTALLPEAFAIARKDGADTSVLEELLGPFDAAALQVLLFDQSPLS